MTKRARRGLALWPLLLLLPASAAPAPSPNANCSSVEPILLQAGNQGVVNGTLAPGCQIVYYVAGTACGSSSYLTMELWDVEQTASYSVGMLSGVPRAQPFLVAARGVAPQGVLNTTSNVWNFSPFNKLVDTAGQSLLRPYLQVQTMFGSTMSSQVPSEAGCSVTKPCWYGLILNSQVIMSHTLNYVFRATCSSQLQCIAPNWNSTTNSAQTCSGNGDCQMVPVPPPQDVACDCEPGWGDVGCNVPLVQLANKVAVNENMLRSGQWDYYEYTVRPGESTVLVEMSRTRGDPILFVKGVQEGFEPGALPSTMDYSLYADRNAWRERSDTAQLIRTNAEPGTYFVGIFNNNEDIQETANYTVTARSSSARAQICPWDCNGNGRCIAAGFCACNSGSGGLYCDGTLSTIPFSKQLSGTLQPGKWTYYALDLTTPESRQQPLTVNFQNDAGQAILLASFNNYPTLLSANFTFRTGMMVGSISQIMQPANLAAGILYIGIYNMDYYVHSAFNYNIQVFPTKPSSPSYTPWISIGVALACSGIVGFLIFQGHRAYLRRRAGARGWMMWSLRPMPVAAPAARRRRSERRRGLDAALVQSFPMYAHDASKLARGESQTPKTESPSEDEKLCSVCLCDYEDGDLIRQLVPCRHDFHSKCIDQWLMKNHTCPMCRVSLIPPGHPRSAVTPEGEGEGAAAAAREGEPESPNLPAAAPSSDIDIVQMEAGGIGEQPDESDSPSSSGTERNEDSHSRNPSPDRLAS